MLIGRKVRPFPIERNDNLTLRMREWDVSVNTKERRS